MSESTCGHDAHIVSTLLNILSCTQSLRAFHAHLHDTPFSWVHIGAQASVTINKQSVGQSW